MRHVPVSPPPGEEVSENVQTNHPHAKNKMQANIKNGTLNMNGLTAPTHGLTALGEWLMINETLNQYKIAILAL